MAKQPSDYCYPGTNTLINFYDEKDPKALDEIETTATFIRLVQMDKAPIKGAFGLKHLQKIHKHIFQDVYPFAGEIRHVNISKNGQGFAPCLHLREYANEVFKQLKNERFLKGLDKESFCERLSFYFTEVNMMHPFREGNGRTQREFFKTLSEKNGYVLDWSLVSKDEMMKASIDGRLDETSFVDVFKKSIVNDQPDQQLIKQYQRMNRSDELEL